MSRFLALRPEPTTATFSTGQTIEIGFCPGCQALHRMTDCPDDRRGDPEGEYCICCEAIRSEMNGAWS